MMSEVRLPCYMDDCTNYIESEHDFGFCKRIDINYPMLIKRWKVELVGMHVEHLPVCAFYYNLPKLGDEIKGVTYLDYPIKSPCNTCGQEKYKLCKSKPEACQELWDFLAQRGDWVSSVNNSLQETKTEVKTE